MRVKKNREVNIFSASVVDLFASGLGVFLIVSIMTEPPPLALLFLCLSPCAFLITPAVWSIVT